MARAAIAVCSILIFSCVSAHAESADTAAAESLFEQGRDLLRAGKASEACPKLAESERLDPATGTLLALALCHKAEGKLASAWAEFVDVEARARRENREDRVQVASDEAKNLHPRLSTLALDVPPEVAATPGLELHRDGVLVGRGAWNIAVPVDGGAHLIEATATGKQPWQKTVQIKPEADSAVVTLSALADAPVVSAPNGSEAEAPLRSAPRSWGALEWAGVSSAGAGVVALGIGGYFLSSALGKKSDSTQDCSGDVCGTRGYAARSSAVSKGNTATIFGVVGGALVGAGAVMFVVGRTRGQHVESARLELGVGAAGLAAQLSGSF